MALWFVLFLPLLAGGLVTPVAARQDGTPPASPVATPTTLLDEETRQRLTMFAFPAGTTPGIFHVGSLGTSIGLRPGESVNLALGVYDDEICGIGHRCFVPLPVAAAWSVAPASGARIDRASGLLTIDPGTTSGRVFIVRAEIEDGRHTVETEVSVYTPEANPLVGTWQEMAQQACGTGEEVAPDLPIEELVFSADGKFTVTWTPFESYVDYWGTYTFDPASGSLDLQITGGNEIPPDVDWRGTATGDGSNHLILADLWLGAPSRGSGEARCGHHFVR